MADDDAMRLFFELFSGLPRQGPGDAESTRRAFSLLPALGPSARILDIGCGTGAQTFDLARLSPASIVAVDFHPPFVDELNRTAARLGLEGRVRGVVGDMKHLDLPPASFDVLWSEGAIFIIGFDAGLEAWRALLREGGHLALTELCWLGPTPAPECAEWLAGEYPAIRDVEANRRAIDAAGYDLVGDFPVPASAWWDDYYHPLERNLSAFRERHVGDPVAGAVAERLEREIAMFRRYSDAYGYVFYVMRKRGD